MEFKLPLFSESGGPQSSALQGFYQERKTLGPRPRTRKNEEGVGSSLMLGSHGCWEPRIREPGWQTSMPLLLVSPYPCSAHPPWDPSLTLPAPQILLLYSISVSLDSALLTPGQCLWIKRTDPFSLWMALHDIYILQNQL